MILPITLYGNPILRKEVEEVETGSANQELKQLVEDMFDTMYHANGVGLAAIAPGFAGVLIHES